MKKKTKKKDTSPQPPTESESKCVRVCKSKYKFIPSVQSEINTLTNKLNCSKEELFEAMIFFVVSNKSSQLAGAEGIVRPLLDAVKRVKSNA